MRSCMCADNSNIAGQASQNDSQQCTAKSERADERGKDMTATAEFSCGDMYTLAQIGSGRIHHGSAGRR
jgi:hypothetical protein